MQISRKTGIMMIRKILKVNPELAHMSELANKNIKGGTIIAFLDTQKLRHRRLKKKKPKSNI